MILVLAAVGLAIGTVLIGKAYRAESIQRVKAEEEKARAEANLELTRESYQKALA